MDQCAIKIGNKIKCWATASEWKRKHCRGCKKSTAMLDRTCILFWSGCPQRKVALVNTTCIEVQEEHVYSLWKVTLKSLVLVRLWRRKTAHWSVWRRIFEQAEALRRVLISWEEDEVKLCKSNSNDRIINNLYFFYLQLQKL